QIMALATRPHIVTTIVMTSTAEEKAFLRVAVAAIPRVTESFPPDDRAGALETAEQQFLAAALVYDCTEVYARYWLSAVMRRLLTLLEIQQESKKKLHALLHRLTEPG